MVKSIRWEMEGPETQVWVCLTRGEAYGIVGEYGYTTDRNRVRTTLRHVPSFFMASKNGNAYVVIRGGADNPEYLCQDGEWRTQN